MIQLTIKLILGNKKKLDKSFRYENINIYKSVAMIARNITCFSCITSFSLRITAKHLHCSFQINSKQAALNTSGKSWLIINYIPLEVSVQCEHVVKSISHNSPLLIFAYFLFKKVGFSFQRDELHKTEWVFGVVDLINS